ncbi:Elongation of fatty acids protein sre1 [Beauveria bassiana]|uniref:Elongation of fatty acids protein n=1 Tax=Beauveria bassiana (strain ARSEF 2860) TaxID=655819 RepID=J5J8G0_BEAB2|nr:GNS1/SUR4 family protein [Beauveria bassiana ARSEF 2860]EJP62648.1 GNS1/SUR4 family protein [Beauveria bassiana ARSEF 2860]KAF1733470.1 Elongation of fatty acids protein sre1 [Beauveria bassiana]KAH8712448.1 Elongation of fatty acids protein sre1 [Beauveria bassiana]
MSVHSGIIGGLPSSKLFSFPPHNPAPPVPPAPVSTLSVMRPFNIPDGLFLGALDARVPITIAATYAVTVKLLNRYNRAHNKQPWAISKTAVFRFFVVVHNIFLAVYSAWTFYGMLGGMRKSIVNPFGPGGLAATADSACRLHGAPGLGNSVYFNEHLTRFESAGPDTPAGVVDAVTGLPNGQQGGRIWNEGLAYYGWIFYLSKFYEVLDTFIILAKGKPSSTLQTYHHAGAMLCMWAGMRYMSAPIWIFVQFNSFIHALMYTYYTVTAFNIRVPVFIKRSLTSMQITQFLVGASLAMCHSFVYYFAPAAASTSTSTPTSDAAGAVESVRALLFGSGADARRIKTIVDQNVSYVSQPCIVSSGETFAIWLNVVYLAPLTYLFVSFFIASYVKRSNAANKFAGKGAAARRLSNVNVDVALAEKAGWDAARGLEREVYGGERMVRSSDNSPTREEVTARRTTRRRG